MSEKYPAYRVFIVRPWHAQASKIHRHLDDGVEHVNGVLAAIQDAAKLHNEQGRFQVEIVFDETTMQPGSTILQQLYVALQACDLTVVLLDGLRPNVVFEYGLVLGMIEAKGEALSRVLGLHATDATVLVRNYFELPTRAPTLAGPDVGVINPPLDISRHFSDISGLFVHRYDRHQIIHTVRDWFLAYFRRDLERGGVPRATVATEADPEGGGTSGAATAQGQTADIWNQYRKGDYEQIIRRADTMKLPDELKALALAYMKSRRVHDAIRVWAHLEKLVAEANELEKMRYTVKLHLGICQYIVGRYEIALALFENAVELEGESAKSKAKGWREKAKEKVVGNFVEPARSVTEE
ncbi:MAG: hypothetical protein IPK71_34750 [Myxococcales bacterium]|nr:hypothetical protein [Myxococcales bacterium]